MGSPGFEIHQGEKFSDLADREITRPRLAKRWQPRTLYYWLARLGASTTGTILVLVLLNIFCYYSTVDGYYLADDFSHVSYLHQVFNGHSDLLLKNFWTNWMQTEGTQFYRPIISLTLAFDYLFWGGNARGFHLSNLVFQVLSSIGVFLVTKRLFLTDLRGKPKEKVAQKEEESQSETKKGTLRYRLSPDHAYTINFCALLAACIFAVHPLHPEVVSWIIGRVDSVCTTFYLFSLWLFLVAIQSQNEKIARRSRLVSLALFVLALGSKEMAVTLPPTLVLLLLFFQTPVYGRARSFPIRVFNAIKGSWRYWLILVIYIVIRTLSLGTIMGGYGGSIGEGLSSSLMERLLSQRTALLVMFPLNLEIFSPGSNWFNYLRIIYGAALGSFVLALLISRSKDTIIKSVLFTGLWFLLVMLPTIPVWNLTDSLQSSRFIYMGTVPLSILLALCICPLSRHGRRKYKGREKTNITLRLTQDFLKGLSATLSVLLVITFSIITEKNNSSWARASNEVKELRKQLAEKVKALPAGKKLALLNTPDRYKGAHMIYNGAQIQVLMEPPLSDFKGADRVLSFEPAMYGDSDLIRASRLKELLASDSSFPVYQWDRENLKLKKLSLSYNIAPRIIAEYKSTESQNQKIPGVPNSIVVSPRLDVPSLDAAFVELTISTPAGENREDLPLILYWNSDKEARFNPFKYLNGTVKQSGKQIIRINTSQHKKWVMAEKIGRFALACPGHEGAVGLDSIRVLSGAGLIPELKCPGKAPDERGIINLPPECKVLDLNFDVSTIAGAEKVLIEISNPNSWFEHYSGTFRDQSPSKHALGDKVIDELKNERYEFDLSEIKQSGFYQIRLAGLDKNNEVRGYFSDPLVLQVSR